MSVRPATLDDIPELVEMARMMHAESPRYRRLSFSAQKVAALTRRMLTGTLTTAPEGGLFIAERGGEPVGMIAGFVTEYFFSHDKVASDYGLFVKPEHRGGFTAAALIRAFERWSTAKQVVDILPGTSTMLDPEGTRDLYCALGYEHYGYSMIKKVK